MFMCCSMTRRLRAVPADPAISAPAGVPQAQVRQPLRPGMTLFLPAVLSNCWRLHCFAGMSAPSAGAKSGGLVFPQLTLSPSERRLKARG